MTEPVPEPESVTPGIEHFNCFRSFIETSTRDRTNAEQQVRVASQHLDRIIAHVRAIEIHRAGLDEAAATAEFEALSTYVAENF
jgi:chemotaxis protein histidine kinase CheA